MEAASQPYLHYLTDELLPETYALLDANPSLRSRVELRDRTEPEAMGVIYSSTDFLFQASPREWSGLAVLEAMSCGCIPIVTDIPSFAKMTKNGRFGRMFTIGDAQAPATAALSVLANQREALAHDVQAHFRASLSFAAIARRIDAIYCDIGTT